MKRIYHWAKQRVHTWYAIPLLSGLVFIEGVLFMPTSSLLMVYCLERRSRAFYYATVTIISSILGGIFGYIAGAFLWDLIGSQLVSLFTTPEKFQQLVEQYQTYSISGVFIATFLPMPYKLVTITAGFCHLPITSYIISISIARAIRFYLIALTAYHWGDKIQQILDDYFYYLIALGIGIMILFYYSVH